MLGNKCGGNYSYTKNGIKNCADCTLPHTKGSYEHVMSKMGLIMEKGKRED
jgi:Zn-finger protein